MQHCEDQSVFILQSTAASESVFVTLVNNQNTIGLLCLFFFYHISHYVLGNKASVYIRLALSQIIHLIRGSDMNKMNSVMCSMCFIHKKRQNKTQSSSRSVFHNDNFK